MGIWHLVRLFKKVIAGTFATCVFVNNICSVARIHADFMQPLISPDGISDFVLLSHVSVTLNRIKCGDVILFRSPVNLNELIFARVKAVGGESVTPNEIDGSEPSVIPVGHYWVECNYRAHDSRSFGPIPRRLVVSRVAATIWPLNRMQFI